jgi:glutathione S-transferase
MKLYYHPVSTVSRPVVLFTMDSGIALDFRLVDLMTGEHLKPAYETINPSRLVPVLEDGNFRLTESSAILKYLADKVDSPAYPKDLQKRARVNEMMDWLNTGFYRDFGYGLVYPQIFPGHRRRSDEAQAAAVEWGRDKAKFWLGALDRHLLGSQKKYLCGNELTIADYLGAGILSIGEVTQCDFAQFPNIARWYASMKARPNWPKANEAFYGMVAAAKDTSFVTV